MAIDDLPPDIRAIYDAGDWRGAARAAEAQGHVGAARAIYATLLDYRETGRLAADAGDPIGALAAWLRGGHTEEAEALRRQMIAELSDELPDAVDVFVAHGRPHAAAELAAATGRLPRAAALFAEARTHLEAAQLYERMDRFREAGQHYEAHLAGTPESVSARLGLARVMQRFDRHREASESLLAAWSGTLRAGTDIDPSVDSEIRDRLAHELLELRLQDAAATVLGDDGWSRVMNPAAFTASYRRRFGQAATGFSERYRIQGEQPGPFTEAYAAHDSMTGSEVVIQALHGTESARARYIGAQRQLAAPRVGGVLGLVESLGEPPRFAAFESPPGPTLADVLRGSSTEGALEDSSASAGGTLTGEQVRNLIRQVLRVVTQCHRQGVVHGSLSPWAVFVGAGLGVVVAGFGLTELGSRAETATAGGVDNPLSYVAPEVAYGNEPDYRADFYGVGAIIHRVLTGMPPLGGPTPHLSSKHPGWFGVLGALLAADPDRRPQRHDDVAARLEGADWAGVDALRKRFGVRETGGAQGAVASARTRPERARWVEEAPMEEAPMEEAPMEEAPPDEAPPDEAPMDEAPMEDAPAATVAGPGARRYRDTWLERSVVRCEVPAGDVATLDRLRALAQPRHCALQRILRVASGTADGGGERGVIRVDLAVPSSTLVQLETVVREGSGALDEGRVLRALTLVAETLADLHAAHQPLGLSATASLWVDPRDGAAWLELAEYLRPVPAHAIESAYRSDTARVASWCVRATGASVAERSMPDAAAALRARYESHQRAARHAAVRARLAGLGQRSDSVG